jgi:hypothetical protein
MRPRLDLGGRVSGQSVEIFEIRPPWEKPEDNMELAVAKATYSRLPRSGMSIGRERV